MTEEAFKGDRVTMKVDFENHEISAYFDTKPEGKVKLVSKQESATKYKVKVEKSGKDEPEFTFSTRKHIAEIGSSNRDRAYFKLLSDRLLESMVIPDYGKVEPKDNIKAFAMDLQTLQADVEDVLKSHEWNGEKEKECKPWTTPEEFSQEIEQKAIEIIENGSLFDEMLDLAENRVINQREKVGLTALVSLSTFSDEPLHGVAMAPPGHGKSVIMDTIFEMFPENRKEKFGKGSTPAALANMTKNAEGKSVLKRKLIRLGDLGNNEELKNFLEVLGILREMMSEGNVSRVITDTSTDENMAQKQELEGIGSVQFSTVAETVEEQYKSRCIIYTPDSSSENTKKVVEFLENDLEVKYKKREFDRKRPIVACAIEKIATYIDKLDKDYEEIWVLNPYAKDYHKRLGLDTNESNNFRNVQQIRELPKSLTLCNIHHRDKYVSKEEKTVAFVLTPEDYIKAFPFFGKTIIQEIKNINPNQIPYLMHIWNIIGEHEQDFESYENYDEQKLNENYWAVLINDGLSFTLQDLEDRLQLKKGTIHPIMKRLVKEKVVYVRQLGPKSQNFYFPTTKLKEYMGELSKTLFDEKSFEGNMDELRKMYNEQINKLEELGFIKETER